MRIIAIIAAFNEGDIISAVIGHLVENGIDVYLLDNHSTDDTVEQAGKWLGRGLLHIERFPQDSMEAGKFDWTAILRRKEELAQELGADWFMHYDADEIREGPWPELKLKEAVRWVDRLGYNCINFRVFNFSPIDDGFKQGDDPQRYFTYFEEPEDFDKIQFKCWKAGIAPISLIPSGGHEVFFEGRRVFPIPFLLRHYPIRGQEHGLRKVFAERKNRFVENERSKGWHRQYDQITTDEYYFLKDPQTLRRFNLDQARLELLLPEAIQADFQTLVVDREKLRVHATALQNERSELQKHVTNIELVLRETQKHRASVEEALEQMRRHAVDLEEEICQFKAHAANLEQERDALRSHATNLEQERHALRDHAKNVEQERDALRGHAGNLEQERDALRTHATNLEQERTEQKLHLSTLDARYQALEREVTAMRNSLIWRWSSPLRRFAKLTNLYGRQRAKEIRKSLRRN